SKSAIPSRIAAQLLALAEHVEVAIISGGNEEQFRTQVIDRLGDADADVLARIHLLPTCGTRYLRHDGSGFALVYARDLNTEQKAAALSALEEEAHRLGLWESETWGPILEDRGSQITFSALGQKAPHDAKKAWDPDGSRRATLRDPVAPRVPDLAVRSGAAPARDTTRPGSDNAPGMTELAERTGIPFADMLFYGDRLDECGNDYPVKALGVPCVAVEGWEDTADHLDALLPTL
ncbi:MAG: HAD family hydrolase, partial [Actinobacteria bacterium]|nr:HAD family hydrolase [Actinomycetota bacterium]